ncbi:MAG: response regulator transcription factor [Cyanobacteria bacterium NC_groundwater_1444_Ag_S-0.65um_54_12]|nr:response regulator transcription factor [Cyanobacteria bacterium NC_groundwater_1444_Ag_S-0.65um_54_12]
MKRTPYILVIEDEAAIRRGLVEVLEAKGYRVVAVSSGLEGLSLAIDPMEPPQLVLLDLMLPGISGAEILQEIRRCAPQLPVIIITAKGQERDKVLGFELGADDYVTKPFSILELLGRVSAVLRRTNGVLDRAVSVGLVIIGLATVDFDQMVLLRDGIARELSVKGFELLHCLLRHRGKVVSRDTLMDEVWGQEAILNSRTIDNYIVKLRQLIEPDPNDPHYLHTVHGAGYRLIL